MSRDCVPRPDMPSSEPSNQAWLRRDVDDAIERISVVDIHTHLYPPDFGALCLWGVDGLVTYHYLIAELFRSAPVRPAQFFALSKREQADAIWETLFVRN